MFKALISIFLLFILLKSTSIEEYGCISDDPSSLISQKNALSIIQAILIANQTDKIIIFPPNKTYYTFPIKIQDIYNITFQISSKLIAYDNITEWPKQSDGKSFSHIIEIINSHYLLLNGGGIIDGQGYQWWWYTIFNALDAERGHMIRMFECSNFIINDLEFRNSPQFHLKLDDITDFTIFNIKIIVDVSSQKNMINLAVKKNTSFLLKFLLWLNIPTFPLNTDGIDPAGRNIHIYNVYIENYDDAVAVKPCHKGFKLSKCSENMLIENSTVKWGVGMTIGSVPPNTQTNCVRNITFRNIVFHTPIKGIYVKTNPGIKGDGIIENIRYENIKMYYPIWWGIYIGPQQQHQPDGSGPGCMIYPLIKECETQPRVTVRNITLKNLESIGNILTPGIIRCNETNPCTSFIFDNVKIGGLFNFRGYITENVEGETINSYPDPEFIKI